MAVTLTNVTVGGPITAYIGDFGETEPAVDAAGIGGAPAVDWTDLGGTNGGATLNIGQDYFIGYIDQMDDAAVAARTRRLTTITTNLAEATLENMAIVLNGGTVTSGTGVKDYQPTDGAGGQQPTYRALIVDGFAPGHTSLRRRVVCRKVLSTNEVGAAFSKDGITLFPVTWTLFAVSSSIKPFQVVDDTAA